MKLNNHISMHVLNYVKECTVCGSLSHLGHHFRIFFLHLLFLYWGSLVMEEAFPPITGYQPNSVQVMRQVCCVPTLWCNSGSLHDALFYLFFFISAFDPVTFCSLSTPGNHFCSPLFVERTSSVTETLLTSWEQWVSLHDKLPGKQQPMWRNKIALQTFPAALWTHFEFHFFKYILQMHFLHFVHLFKHGYNVDGV